MNTDDLIRLRHMLDAAQEAQTFVAGRTHSDLDTDRMLLLALVKDIEVIGEAASRISPEVRTAHPEIPWPAIITMRHRLIHAYFDINTETVWSTITEDIPPLITALAGIITPRS
jgi:uncharacterized protein with HEPN domain